MVAHLSSSSLVGLLLGVFRHVSGVVVCMFRSLCGVRLLARVVSRVHAGAQKVTDHGRTDETNTQNDEPYL